MPPAAAGSARRCHRRKSHTHQASSCRPRWWRRFAEHGEELRRFLQGVLRDGSLAAIACRPPLPSWSSGGTKAARKPGKPGCSGSPFTRRWLFAVGQPWETRSSARSPGRAPQSPLGGRAGDWAGSGGCGQSRTRRAPAGGAADCADANLRGKDFCRHCSRAEDSSGNRPRADANGTDETQNQIGR